MMAMLKIGFGAGWLRDTAGSAAGAGMGAGGVGVGAGVWFGSTPGGVGMVWALVGVLLKAMGCPVSLLGMGGPCGRRKCAPPSVYRRKDGPPLHRLEWRRVSASAANLQDRQIRAPLTAPRRR